MDFTPFIRILSALKVLHWTSKRYSAHVALEKAYDDLGDKIDEFIECYLGVTNKADGGLREFSLPDNLHREPDKVFGQLMNEFLGEVNRYNASSGIGSLIDDMENIGARIIYLLRMQ